MLIRKMVNEAVIYALKDEAILRSENEKILKEFLLKIKNVNSHLIGTEEFKSYLNDIIYNTDYENGQDIILSFLTKVNNNLIALSYESRYNIDYLDFGNEILNRFTDLFSTNLIDSELRKLLEIKELNDKIDSNLILSFLLINFLDAEELIKKG